jgi:hypothetical protein
MLKTTFCMCKNCDPVGLQPPFFFPECISIIAAYLFFEKKHEGVGPQRGVGFFSVVRPKIWKVHTTRGLRSFE